MPTFSGTLSRVTARGLPSDVLMATNDPRVPILFLLVPPGARNTVDRAISMGSVTRVTGDVIFRSQSGLPVMAVTRIEIPNPLEGEVTSPTVARVTGQIFRPAIPIQGVTHLLVDETNEIWLLTATGQRLAELNLFLNLAQPATVQGVVVRMIGTRPLIRVDSVSLGPSPRLLAAQAQLGPAM